MPCLLPEKEYAERSHELDVSVDTWDEQLDRVEARLELEDRVEVSLELEESTPVRQYLGPGRLLLLPHGDGTWPAAGIYSLGDCTFLWHPAILSKLLLARTLVCPQVRLNIGHQGRSLGIKCKKDKNNNLVVTKIIDDGPAYLEGSLQVKNV